METFALTAPDREERNPWLVVCFRLFLIGCCLLFAAVVGGRWDDKTRLRLQAYLSCTVGWMIGVFMGEVLALSVLGRQGVIVAPALLSVALTFLGASTAAYFLSRQFTTWAGKLFLT
jgi:4-amino-4-deoxy-L-arabinose transferase-like glycosyltransferase